MDNIKVCCFLSLNQWSWLRGGGIYVSPWALGNCGLSLSSEETEPFCCSHIGWLTAAHKRPSFWRVRRPQRLSAARWACPSRKEFCRYSSTAPAPWRRHTWHPLHLRSARHHPHSYDCFEKTKKKKKENKLKIVKNEEKMTNSSASLALFLSRHCFHAAAVVPLRASSKRADRAPSDGAWHWGVQKQRMLWWLYRGHFAKHFKHECALAVQGHYATRLSPYISLLSLISLYHSLCSLVCVFVCFTLWACPWTCCCEYRASICVPWCGGLPLQM